MSSKQVESLITTIRSAKKSTLKIEKSNLTSLPLEEIRKKPMASHASFSFNSLFTLPSATIFEIANIGWKHSLTELYLSNNFIETLPREISLFVQLRILTLDNNRLRSLPKDIGKLVNLETLSFAHNLVMELPVEMGQLLSLKKLRFTSNLIRKFPRSFGRLEALRKVRYDFNPLTYPPPEIVKQGWLSIRGYLCEPLKFILKKYSMTCPFENDLTMIGGQAITKGPLAEVTAALKRTLNSNEHRAAFARFLEKECSLENLLFWQDIETLNSREEYLQADDYQTEATRIYSKYIADKLVEEAAETEVQQVNLPCEIKSKCVEMFAPFVLENQPSYNLSDGPPPSLDQIKKTLQEAQWSIFNLLALDSYQRFCSEENKRSGSGSISRQHSYS